LLTDQAMVSWVINFDKQSSTWRHPLAGHTGGSGANNIIYFESRDADGNGTLVFHNLGTIGSGGVQHEVRCEVTIPPNSWHTITFIQQDEGALTGKDGRRVRFFVDGYEKLSTINTEGQTSSAAQAKWEHLGKINGWYLSGKIADIRVRSARSTASPAITSAGSDAEQQAVEMDLADTYDLTAHRLHSSKYTLDPEIPRTPSGSKLLFHLKPDLKDMEIFSGSTQISTNEDSGFASNTPNLSSEIAGATVSQWHNSGDSEKDVGAGTTADYLARYFTQSTAGSRPTLSTNVCNGYPGVNFSSAKYLEASTNDSGNNSDLFGGSSHEADNIAGINIFAVVKLSKNNNTGAIATCQGINLGLGNATSGSVYSAYSFFFENFGDLGPGAEAGLGSAFVVAHSRLNETTMDSYQYNQTPEANTDNLNSDFQNDAGLPGTANPKWAPFNGLSNLGTQAHVVSISYNGSGEPRVRIDGQLIMDYTGDSAERADGTTRKKYDDTYSAGVSMLRDWFLGKNPNSTNLASFDGHIIEFAAYTRDSSAMNEQEHLGVVDYMLDKYQINSARRGSHYDFSGPMGRGAAGEKTWGSLPAFWINSGLRPSGARANLRLEARIPEEASGLGLKSIKLYSPAYAWLKYTEPENLVNAETPVTVLIESEKAMVIKRGWEEISSGNPIYYTSRIEESQEVTRVLINGVEAVRSRLSSFPSYGAAWHWDEDSNVLYLVMDAADQSPNHSDNTIAVVLLGRYSRESEDIRELSMPIISSSTAKNPNSTSDDAAINSSIYPDTATQGAREVPYEPRVSSIPGYSKAMEMTGGNMSAPSGYGDFVLAAGDGEFDQDSGQKIFEGLKAKIYRGYSSIDKRKDSFELLLEGRQGLPTLSDTTFKLNLYDTSLGFNDALDSSVYEVNADDTSNGVVKYSSAEYPIYFGRNYRIPATRVTHAQLTKFNTSPGVSETAYFKVSNHFYALLSNEDGTTNCKAVYSNNTDEVPFQVKCHEQNSSHSIAVWDSLVVDTPALRLAGLVGIRVDNNQLDVNASNKSGATVLTTDYDSIITATTIYLDIDGMSVPHRANAPVSTSPLNRDSIDSPGRIYQYLAENYPVTRDEQNGFYSTTITAEYTPKITELASGDAITLASHASNQSDFDNNFNADIGSKVLLAQEIDSSTGASRYLHGIVVQTDTSNYAAPKIWIQPQFVALDVRLDNLVASSGGDYFTNAALAADKFTTGGGGTKVIVYEKFNGLSAESINHNSFREIDKLHRIKQDSNDAALRAVRYPTPVQAGFSVPGSGTLQGALSAVGEQFFTFYYIDKNGRFVADVPDLKRKNLLINPGFEKTNLIASRGEGVDSASTLTTSSGIRKVGNPWEVKNYVPASSDTISSSFVYTGKQSFVLESGTSKAFLEQSVPLGPGKYVFTAVVAAGSTGASSTTALSAILPSGDSPEIFSEYVSPSSSDWQRVTLAFEVKGKGSGTTKVRIYPDAASSRGGSGTLSIRVDDCELYEVVAFAEDNSADYFPVSFEEENYYETKVGFLKSPVHPTGLGYKIVDDTTARSAGLASSESRASLESAGRLNLDEVNASGAHDAIEIAAKATGYYGQMRARMSFSLLDFDRIPSIGDAIYERIEGRSIQSSDDYPIWIISSVEYDAQNSANEISVEALRAMDTVSDRSKVTSVGLPIGAIVVCTDSACPTGFTLVSGFERQHIGIPAPGAIPSSSQLGGFKHTHTVVHSHANSAHTHTETIGQSGSASETPGGDGSFGVVSLGTSGVVNRIGAAGPNHTHSPSSATLTTGATVDGNITEDTQTLRGAVNSHSYISVLLCKRTGSFVKESNSNTATTNIPRAATFGWESAAAPSDYEENSAFASSEPLLIQVRGGYAAAISGVSIIDVRTSFNNPSAPTDEDLDFTIQVADSSIFEPRRVITATDASSNQIQLMITTIYPDQNMLQVFKMNGILFDTAYSNAGTKFDHSGFPASSGWTLSSPADAPGAKITGRGYHSHGSDKGSSYNILSSHAHVASHSHAAGSTSTTLGEFTPNSGNITTYNSGKDLNIGKTQNSHAGFGAVGNLPILFGASEVECNTNQMATAADYSILTEQHEWDGANGHNKVDWDGGGGADITDWTQAPNSAGVALSPYNHHHALAPNGANQIAFATLEAGGVGGADFGANRSTPTSYLLNWIRTEADGSGDSKTAEIPTGAIILIDGDRCPFGYAQLVEGSNYLVGVQVTGSSGATTQDATHTHSVTAAEHANISHNHGTQDAGQSGGAMLPGGVAPKYRVSDNSGDWDGDYYYFNSFVNGDGRYNGSTSAHKIDNPILFPTDLSVALWTGDPVDNSPAYPTILIFQGAVDAFAGFVSVNEVSGSEFNVATSSSTSHVHSQQSSTDSVNVKLNSTTFTSSDVDAGTGSLNPPYKELLLCKKI